MLFDVCVCLPKDEAKDTRPTVVESRRGMESAAVQIREARSRRIPASRDIARLPGKLLRRCTAPTRSAIHHPTQRDPNRRTPAREHKSRIQTHKPKAIHPSADETKRPKYLLCFALFAPKAESWVSRSIIQETPLFQRRP
ncbi:hypothetical protein DPMN_192657 [Dreissena polymorpha]|uniref:Uncharacterized protein n=1 Tax=Dreissena polymorpha TaxID=45954 RepID=A0A9D3Y3M1_DREPO|nr:hypothetical protein DPMN_192657 [Dreissena polymorpha]